MLSAAEASLMLRRYITFRTMEEAVFRALYKQFMFFSDNGVEIIENPSIAMSEACKCCGKPREEVREVLKAFEEYGLVKRVDREKFGYRMTEAGITQPNVEELIKRLTTPQEHPTKQ